jgi:hypothetical protein
MTMFVLFRKGFIGLLAVCLGAALLSSCSLPYSVPCNVVDLIQHINEANDTPATTDTLILTQGCVYALDRVDNETEGANGLPVITSRIIINGNDAVIRRSMAAQDRFRLFYIAGNGYLTLNHLTLTGGHAFDPNDPSNWGTNSGGAIFNRGRLSIHAGILRMNVANSNGEGGAIANVGTMEIVDSTLDSNEDGINTILGGAAIFNLGDATLIGSTISRNGIPEEQDAIWTGGTGTLSMVNCTISGNGRSGIDHESTVYLNHVTFAFNGGLGMSGVSGDTTVANSLFAFNGLGGCNDPPTYPGPFNMDTDGSCGGLTVLESDLRLAPLGNYGGPTETHALLPGSAAIDVVPAGAAPVPHVSADCLPVDQRGQPRPFGPACDVGAYEFPEHDVDPAPLLAPTDTVAARACTFTAAVDLNCRAGPGMTTYPVLDWLTAGESASVVGRSADGQYAYLIGPRTAEVCVVPINPDYGALVGEACNELAVFTPPPLPTLTPPAAGPPTGCTVQDLRSAEVRCVAPCPAGAVPGEACTP